ncbi:Golgi to ER traffic protein 4 homolog [Gryllus bimaculatus]|nr:Golgi to ER traffic protein 4 homolog [Gryllus bimaculatus]
MATKSMHGVHRVLSKLELSINAGNFYEAHQLYRTLYFRYLGQKKYAELIDLLYDGAILLLHHNQHTSGADLAILLVDVLTKSETESSDDLFEKLSRLFELIGSEVPERETYLSNALQWSARVTQEHKSGHPYFHQSIAQIFWREKNYTLARYHFLHSTDGSGCATMLVELHKQRGYASEIDLFIAQAVLQYLCLQNKRSATEAFKSYTTQHPNIKTGPPYILPLLNFIWFLLKAVESGKLGAFVVLCEKYEPSIKRNLLQSFLSGLDDSDSDEDSARPPARASTSHQMETDEQD